MVGLVKLALASVFAATVARPALAADWLRDIVSPPPGVEIHDDPVVELGSGWYLRGDAGAGFDTISKFGSKPTMQTWSVDFAAGYKFNNWFRMDAELGLRKPQSTFSTTQTLNGAQIICPSPSGAQSALQVLSNGTTPIGYAWDENLGTCHQDKAVELRSMTLMLNGFVDLGTWSGFTPYVGAGVGVARVTANATTNYFNNADGTLYAPTAAQWTETGGVPLVWLNRFGVPVFPVNPNNGLPVSIASPPKWNERNSSVRYNFAWALMAGVAYSITDRAKLDVGFRYMNLGNFQTVAGGPSGNITSKEVKVGLRYQID
jgi:opacity protein-like surface antigen